MDEPHTPKIKKIEISNLATHTQTHIIHTYGHTMYVYYNIWGGTINQNIINSISLS